MLQTQDSLNELSLGSLMLFLSFLYSVIWQEVEEYIHIQCTHKEQSRLRKLVSPCHLAKPEEFSLFITRFKLKTKWEGATTHTL